MIGQRRRTAALPLCKQSSSRTYAIKGPILGMEVVVKRQTCRHVEDLIPISSSWLLTILTELLQLTNLVLRKKVLDTAFLLLEVDGTWQS